MSRKAKMSYEPVDWTEYRRMKKTVLMLFIGFVPVGLLCGAAITRFPGNDIVVYSVFTFYMLYWTYQFMNYLSYACPHCGVNLSGCQLYSKSCRKCGAKINPPRS